MTLDDLLSLPEEDFLRAVYSVILGRDADEAGLQNYRRRLVQGVSKATIVAEIAQSDEAKARSAHADLAQLPDDEFVDAIYQRALGRRADPESKQHYLNSLQKHGDRGLIARSVETNDEALQHNPCAAYFKRDLNILLRRERSAMGWRKWREPSTVRCVATNHRAVESLIKGIAKASDTTCDQIGTLGATIDQLLKLQRAESDALRDQITTLGHALEGAVNTLRQVAEITTSTRDHVRLLTGAVEGMANAKGLTATKR